MAKALVRGMELFSFDNSDVWKKSAVEPKIIHEWIFDLPWQMVNLKDWFYMVNFGYIEPTFFLHVRILGIRSLWKVLF